MSKQLALTLLWALMLPLVCLADVPQNDQGGTVLGRPPRRLDPKLVAEAQEYLESRTSQVKKHISHHTEMLRQNGEVLPEADSKPADLPRGSMQMQMQGRIVKVGEKCTVSAMGEASITGAADRQFYIALAIVTKSRHGRRRMASSTGNICRSGQPLKINLRHGSATRVTGVYDVLGVLSARRIADAKPYVLDVVKLTYTVVAGKE